MKTLAIILALSLLVGCMTPTQQHITYNIYMPDNHEVPAKIIVEHKEVPVEKELDGWDYFSLATPWAILGVILWI